MTKAKTETTTPGVAGRTNEARDFRLDIGALRAVAVVLVVLFHFGVPPFTGGFIGVDVFFVISGYLMTRIIVGGMDRGRFTVLGFYLARFRRIVPALAVLCAALVAFGLLVVDPLSATKLARNALYSLLFVSNFPYAFEQSYFADASEQNWLLHTWTLSVEWQFYMLYPLALVALRRWRFVWERRFAVASAACLALFAATVAVCSISSQFYQVGFFILPSRAWEMLAGGCVALAPAYRLSSRLSVILQLAGLAAILFAGCGFDSRLPWPSGWTAIPVIGAAAILVARCNAPIWVRAAPVQAFGTWSYSMYLWHWPVVVGLHYFFAGKPGPLAIALGLAATLALSVASYTLVETRLRDFLFDRRHSPSWRWLAAGGGFAAVAVLCLIGWRSAGLEQLRVAGLDPSTRAALADYHAATEDWAGQSACKGAIGPFAGGHLCRLGDPAATDVAVIGDSHVEQLLPRYAGLLRGAAGATFVYKDGCPPIPALERTIAGYHCQRFVKAAFERAKAAHFKRVVLVSAWSVYLQESDGALKTYDVCAPDLAGRCAPAADSNAFKNTVESAFGSLTTAIEDLKASGVTVSVVNIEPAPYSDSASSLYRDTFLARKPVVAPAIATTAFDDRYAFTRTALSDAVTKAGVELIDPTRFLCPLGSCAAYDDGKFLFKDSHHVRASIVTDAKYGYLDPLIAAPGSAAR
jgi:peptidoglycan/LPS O-acetylase OafA/YrhL